MMNYRGGFFRRFFGLTSVSRWLPLALGLLLSLEGFTEIPPQRLDLYLLVGQSNMAGRGKLTAENRLPADGVWKLDKHDRWVAAKEPLHFDKSVAGAGLAMSFARSLREREPSVEIGLIPCAVGGTPLSRWMPGKDLYTNAVRRAKIAQRQGVIRGILWHQGEGDCGKPELRETYAARLGKMVRSLRADLGLADDVPFLAGELGEFLEKRHPGSQHPVINAQIKSCEMSVPSFRCISSAGLTPNGDNLHFNTESLRTFGHRYAEAYLSLRKKAEPGQILRFDPAADKTADRTADLQQAIDRASASGGGEVRVSSGDYPVKQIFLKDGVTLHLEAGARLLGSTNRTDYVQTPIGGSSFRWPAVICADGARNIALVGQGTVDGRGWVIGPYDKSAGRWRDVLFYRCRNVLIEDVSLINPASWTLYLKECEKAVVRRVKINAPWAWNNDGIDIDAKDVLVEDCEIDSDDDAICLKSDNPDFLCENIEVRNCRIASCCNHIKLGTASHGGFRKVNIHHCQLVSCATNIIPQVKFANDHRTGRKLLPGVDEKDILSRIGIAVECVDGGLVDDVWIHDITMTRCVQTPVFVRLGRRHEREGVVSSVRNVCIENVTGSAASHLASSITGVPGLRPRDITIRNCAFTLKGGAKLADCADPVPEAEKAYPENQMFDRHMLPAYGFYVRHADGVLFDNVRITCASPDERPPVVVDDSTKVETVNCSFDLSGE